MFLKAGLLAFGALAALASAQLAGLPKCALSPALSVVGGQSKCQLTEFSCICANQELLASLTAAVQKSCTDAKDLMTAKAAADSICMPYAATAGGSNSATATGSAGAGAGGVSSSTTATATSGAPYAAGNATAPRASTGSSVSSATGSPIATGNAVKAAAAGTKGEGFVAAIMAVFGVLMFF